MLYTIRNLGLFFLMTACLTSCGQKPAENSQAIKDLEAKEKKLLDELKPLWEDDQAENWTAKGLVEGMLTPNTPKYKLNERLALLLTDIKDKEKALKKEEKKEQGTPEADLEQDPFKKDKVLEGLKKEIELLKVRQEKFELALGLNKSA
jgi:transcriptional regulator of heat shock response